jgi:hypothetical protein
LRPAKKTFISAGGSTLRGLRFAAHSLVKEGNAVKKQRMAVLACCIVLLGCGISAPIAEEFGKSTNLFGSAFQDRDEVLALIPVGTPVEKAQAEMRAHGYELISSQKQGDQLTLFFHRPDLGGLVDPSKDRPVAISCNQGKVVEIEFRVP